MDTDEKFYLYSSMAFLELGVPFNDLLANAVKSILTMAASSNTSANSGVAARFGSHAPM